MLKAISSEAFDAQVIQAEGPVLIDFGAEWCHPCKRLDPIVEELAAEWDGRVVVYKLDVDHATDIAMRFQVMGVPTLILFKGGEPVQRLTGFAPRRKVIRVFEPYLMEDA